jgi:hypothetical protein
MGEACSMHEDIRKAYTILVCKPEGKKHNERSKSRWEDNIRMIYRNRLGRDELDSTAVVNTYMILGSIKGGLFPDQLSDY